MSNFKRMRVILFTENTKIEGIISVREGFRISDYLNKEKGPFIPLNDVCVRDFSGRVQLDTNFLCVNKHKIIAVKTKE